MYFVIMWISYIVTNLNCKLVKHKCLNYVIIDYYYYYFKKQLHVDWKW